MTAPTAKSLFLALLSLVAGALRAQSPKDPPPWWGIADEDTVSLFWDFNNGGNPLQPTVQVLPSWYSPLPTAANNFGFTNSANIAWIPSLQGNTGVLGFTGTGTGTIAQLVENDFRPYWIKIFFIQFDSLAQGASTVTASVKKDLAKYERGIIEEKTEAIPGSTWVRTTLGMYLIPQPVNEELDIVLTEAATNSVAIDNLFVNSKCVKPPPDEKGTAFGEVDSSYDVNLASATGNAACTATAATEDSNQVLSYWVAGRSGANQDQIFRLSPTGVLVGAPVLMPVTGAAFGGASDLAVMREVVPGPTPTVRQFVCGIFDRRPTGGPIDIVVVDADAPVPTVVPARQVTLPGVPTLGPGPLSIAYTPHAFLGAGGFWICDQAGNLVEVSRTGVVGRTFTNAANSVPTGTSGLGYDPMTGHLYFFITQLRPLPNGAQTRVLGIEFDGYTMSPTGVQFLGDRSIPGPLPGGAAAGLEVLRRENGDFRLLCVQQNGVATFQRALRGPFRFGWSLLGRVGARGLPMVGQPWQVDVHGVPHAVAAICFFGVTNQQHLGFPLPIPLAGIGLQESRLSISPITDSGLLPVVSGTSTYNLTVPPTLPPGTPVFFQWAVFDPNVQGSVAASQAGETIIY